MIALRRSREDKLLAMMALIAIVTAPNCGATGIFPEFLLDNTTGVADRIFLGPPDGAARGIGLQRVTYDLRSQPVVDRPGRDFNLYESLGGLVEFDSIDVLVSDDGVDFESVGASRTSVRRIAGDEAFDVVDSFFTGPPDGRSLSVEQRSLTFDFGRSAIADGDGPDFSLYESPGGLPEFSAIDVLVSSDGTDYVSVAGSLGTLHRVPGDEGFDAVDALFTGPPDGRGMSIGSGGAIFDFGRLALADAPGPDFNVYETSSGISEFDQIDVLVSANGSSFVSVGSTQSEVVRIAGDDALENAEFARSYDLDSSGLSSARFVWIDGTSVEPAGIGGFELDAIGAISLVDPFVDVFPAMLSENTAGAAFGRSYDLAGSGVIGARFVRIVGTSNEFGGIELDALGAVNVADEGGRFPAKLLDNAVGAQFAASYDLAGTGFPSARFIRIAGTNDEFGGFELDAVAIAVAQVPEAPASILIATGFAALACISLARSRRS